MSGPVEYVASDALRYLYPRAGDPLPPGGAKVLLLTCGGTCVVGQWPSDPRAAGYYAGWAPLPKRDKGKEASLGLLPASLARAGYTAEGLERDNPYNAWMSNT